MKPDRRVFAFRNGIFVAGVDSEVREEYYQAHPEDRENLFCTLENAFFDYETSILPNCVACNFIDMEFDTSVFDYDDYFDVPTPEFDHVLKYQGFDDPELGDDLIVMRWIYALGIGKMLYDVRDRENWECILFLKGIAGSGKSTISQVISALYPKNKVGAVSNRIEKSFGLGALVDMWVWVAKEVKSNFGIDQVSFAPQNAPNVVDTLTS